MTNPPDEPPAPRLPDYGPGYDWPLIDAGIEQPDPEAPQPEIPDVIPTSAPPRTVHLSVRVPPELYDALRAAAKSRRTKLSDYVRTLLSAAMILDVGPASWALDPPKPPEGAVFDEVVLVTDRPIEALRTAVDKWGTNHNQAVRAFNTLARYLCTTSADAVDMSEVELVLRAAAQAEERAWQGIRELDRSLEPLYETRKFLDLRRKKRRRRKEKVR